MLPGLLDVAQLHVGEGEAVRGLRVMMLDLEGLAQAVRAFRLSPSSPKIAPRFLRAPGFLGSAAKARMAYSFARARYDFHGH